MKKIEGPYIPMSDCECYLMALELVDQEIEKSEKYIYVNDWLNEKTCSGEPFGIEDMIDLVKAGKKLIYFNTSDGNVYLSTGTYDEVNGNVYFSLYENCNGEVQDYEIYIDNELHVGGSYSELLQYRPYILDILTDLNYVHTQYGVTVPANAVGVLSQPGSGWPLPADGAIQFVSYSGFACIVPYIFSGIVRSLVLWNAGSSDDGTIWNFANGYDHTKYPYLKVVHGLYGGQPYPMIFIIDETNA